MSYYDEISRGYEELHREEQEKKIALIKQHLKVNPEEKLLDVGCGTGLTTRPWKCKRFGIDPSKKLLEKAKKSDPGGTYKLAPAESIPFKDNEFDWVFSNAVIEHVGDNNAQVYFVNEMIRVGKNVFFTTPYKYFPIESHTDVFFLHWNNNLFYSWCKKHKPWCTKDHLYLFSRKRLESILRQSNADSYQIYNNRFLGMTMTFTVLCSD